jgi:hypothetical protein
LFVNDTQPEIDLVGFLKVWKSADVSMRRVMTHWAPFGERLRMPLPHARMIHIGRKVYRCHTTTLALAGTLAKVGENLGYLPLGLGDGIALVGKQCMLLEDRPSSTDNVLSFVSPHISHRKKSLLTH